MDRRLHLRSLLDQALADPRYSNPSRRDPAFVQAVSDGFKKLAAADDAARKAEWAQQRAGWEAHHAAKEGGR